MEYQIRKSYWKFIEDEAQAICSDGCTGVNDWHKECCYEHDLSCHYEKDPRSAYAYYTANPRSHYWTLAVPMNRTQADYAFAKCNWQWSCNSPSKCRSILRFLGVRIGAWLGIGVRQPKEC